MPKAGASPMRRQRHDPLITQLQEDDVNAKYGRITAPGKRTKQKKRADVDDQVILDPKTSQKIFELARHQQEELESDDDDPEVSESNLPRLHEEIIDDEDGDSDLEHDDTEEVEEVEIDAEDMQTLDALLPSSSGERKTLADIIFAKLDNQEEGQVSRIRQDRENPDPALGLDPQLVAAYSKVALGMSRYKSGPLPKLLKVIPTLPLWSRLLAITEPQNWTPQACRAVTRIFISTMKPAQAKIYLEVVLLDAIREDIASNKKLNVHYYECLKRALYKPAAFFKGIIFPLLNTGCTLREAAIISSVVAKRTIPELHSSAALMHILNMDYTGPNALLIRVLIDKKYNLPFQVIDALVFHFIRISNTYRAKTRGEAEKLPVLWHQSLLSFSQRYAPELTPDQKDALLDVVRVNFHPQIGPEVRRELVNAVARGEPRPDDMQL